MDYYWWQLICKRWSKIIIMVHDSITIKKTKAKKTTSNKIWQNENERWGRTICRTLLGAHWESQKTHETLGLVSHHHYPQQHHVECAAEEIRPRRVTKNPLLQIHYVLKKRFWLLKTTHLPLRVGKVSVLYDKFQGV